MKYLLIITLALSMCVSNAMEKTSGSNTPDKQYVRVLGTGKTEEEAKLNGFKNAIIKVVGTIVVTEKEAKDTFLTRNEVATYSSGYVDDYKIVDKVDSWAGPMLIMDVLVKSSKIANQILGISKGDAELEGSKLATQYKSYLDERRSGDIFVDKVLNTYPKNAFNIKMGEVQFKLDSYRNSLLIVPYEVSYNYNWIMSLREVFKIMADGDNYSPDRVRIIAKKPGSWFGDTVEYNFNDTTRLDRIGSYLSVDTVIQLKIVDKNGDALYTTCGQKSFIGIGYGNNYHSTDRWIRGNEVYEFQDVIKISPDSPAYNRLDKMSKVEVNIIKAPVYGPGRDKYPECDLN